ncbi:MAG: hypothetical protein MUF22_03765 [Chitinispirillaceae bacterium]|jgi:Na+/melibiose symporter-like transporter|nr:hypothetical protein [Chitinispirillaceae bacterium]
MDYSTILIKIAGVVLLLWTLRSIYRHFAGKKIAQAEPADKKPSFSEALLNNILLYLWFAFMLVFSAGMILNN